MNVYKCNLWGVIPEEIETTDLVSLTKDVILNRVKFSLKCVPEGTDPVKIDSLLMGYFPYYNRLYLSDLSRDKGLVWVNCESMRLIYDPNGTHISSHRDSVHYIGAPTRYIREGFSEVMNEFEKAGFKKEIFRPYRPGDSIIV